MFLADTQCRDGSFASHTDGGLRVNPEVGTGAGGSEEWFEPVGKVRHAASI
jgi:hypothetical protein